MNLLGKDGRGLYTIHSQDQLVRIPGGAVPEPGSILVWSGLTAGMAGAFVRKARSPR